MRKQWNENEIKFIKENYKTMTNKDIAEKIGRTKTAVDLKINKLGLKKSKYIYNHNFFNEIDSEEKAYWFGFICADGYISISGDYGKELGIELQVGDKGHLKKFNKSIEGNVDVKEFISICNLNNKEYKKCSIRLYSKKMVEALMKLGITNKKSYDLRLPKFKDDLMRHFIRGYFDGDGCICESKRKKHISTIRCDFTCGCKEYMEELRKFLYAKGINSYIIKEKDNPYRLMIGGLNNCDKFLNYIYKDSNISLDRKYNKTLKLYKDLNIKERILPR